MNTKFKIGDKVSYISGVGGAETVFTIKHITIDENYITYSDLQKNDVYESNLTLYKEPKKKRKIHERLSRNIDGSYRVFFCGDLTSIPLNTILTGRTLEVDDE